MMGLEKFINYYPNKLSGGMQRRVALARSFATEPEVLILDEPFISLDEPIAEILREMLIKLWTKQPTTIIFVTHDLNKAIYLSDRVVFLSKAPATQEGPESIPTKYSQTSIKCIISDLFKDLQLMNCFSYLEFFTIS